MLIHCEAELQLPGSGCLGVVLAKGASDYLLRGQTGTFFLL